MAALLSYFKKNILNEICSVLILPTCTLVQWTGSYKRDKSYIYASNEGELWSASISGRLWVLGPFAGSTKHFSALTICRSTGRKDDKRHKQMYKSSQNVQAFTLCLEDFIFFSPSRPCSQIGQCCGEQRGIIIQVTTLVTCSSRTANSYLQREITVNIYIFFHRPEQHERLEQRLPLQLAPN